MTMKSLLTATAIISTLLAVSAEAQTPKCDGKTNGCWLKAKDRDCYMWLVWRDNTDVDWTWTGQCANGMAEGKGVVRSAGGDVLEGRYENGKQEGNWVEHYAKGRMEEGPYKNGKRDGHWIRRTTSGGFLSKGRYENGKEEGIWAYYVGDDRTEFRFVNGEIQ